MHNQDHDIHNWRAVLRKIIQPPKERQRIAAALGVNMITLTRWVKPNSRPQRASLARLVKVINPQQKAELLEALKLAYPDMQEKLVEETAVVVPSSLYRSILKEQASVLENMRGQQIASTLLNAALELLDPHHVGLAITPCLCMPPIGEGKDRSIRSLREEGGRYSHPWPPELEHRSLFLGLNCLAGHVVQTGRPISIGDLTKKHYIPTLAYPSDREASAAACPIFLEGRIAGCLLAASTERDHFNQERMDLLINLTAIYAIALNPEDFYDPLLLRLRYIPHPSRQQEVVLSFRPRVNSLMIESMRNAQALTNTMAEKIIWQQIESQLIQMGIDEESESQPGA